MIGVPHLNIPIIKDRLLFSILKCSPRNSSETFYFSIENNPEYEYRPFCQDFGPPSLLQLYKFTNYVESLLKSRKEKYIHFYSTPNQEFKSNNVMYIAFFRMIHFNLNAEDAYKPLNKIAGILLPFRDVSNGPSFFDLHIIDILRGIHKAIENGWFNFEHFNAEQWEFLQKLENGNMNWIIPGKLLSFSSPYSFEALPGNPTIKVATTKTVIPIFQRDDMKINYIVRLNKHYYNSNDFIEAGFKHTELYFDDGTVPSDSIVQEFLKIVDDQDNIVAVHCKSGLGRAGTLCGCYLKYKYEFTGREAIGWLRVCRPGSVIGPQQQFLMKFMNKDYSVYNNNNPSLTINSAARPITANPCNFVFSRNYLNSGNYKNITLGNTGFSQTSNIPPEYEPPIKRMFTNPAKGFKLDTINVADYYCNNPKFVEFVGAMPPQPPKEQVAASPRSARNGRIATMQYERNFNKTVVPKVAYTQPPRQAPKTKFWTSPKEKLTGPITIPIGPPQSKPVRKYRRS